jgi:DNA-binding MarR family transcriptional regulator
MEQKLVCTLCDNRCPLNALGCRKGQRFYEINTDPYCTLCENHCLLSDLQCEKGTEFYGAPSGKRLPILSQPKEAQDFYMLFEMVSYQFQRVRGGQTSQIRVMRFLHNHGSANLKALQEALAIKSAAMSELVAKLEERELVVRTQSATDKRVKEIRLTEAGERTILQQMERERQMDLFSCLSEEERSALETALRKLNFEWRKREAGAFSTLDAEQN